MATDLLPEFVPFYDELAEGTIAFPHCRACGRHHWYPMQLCPHCGSTELEWSPVAGDGVLYSWTVVRHAFTPEYADKIPYTVALVEFPDAPGVRLVTQLVDTDGVEVHCGMPVVADVRRGGDERATVVFRPAG